MTNQYSETLDFVIALTLFYSLQQMWDISSNFNPTMNPLTRPDLPFFTPLENMGRGGGWENQMVLSMDTTNDDTTTSITRTILCKELSSPSSPRAGVGGNKGRNGGRPYVQKKTSLRGVALMLFLEVEGKNFIFNWPITLTKCLLDIHPPINCAAAKFAVVLSPILEEIPHLEDVNEKPNRTLPGPGCPPPIFLPEF